VKRWLSHAAGVGVLCLAGLLMHGRALTAPAPLGDEVAYVCAAEAVVRGQSPYAECPRYFYPPILARSGAVLVSFGGRAALLVALRALVWLGAVTSVWLALALTRWSFRTRVVVGTLVMLAAPPIDQALELGNLSSATAGFTIAALFALEQSAVMAAVLLTLAILLKPLPAIVPCLLVAQGLALSRVERGTLPKPLIAGAATALTCGVLFALTGGLGAWQQFYASAENNIAVVRVVRAFGLMAPPGLVTALAALCGAGLAARYAREPRLIAGLALVTCLLSAPLVWNHSWLIVLPVLAAAADRAVAGFHDAPQRSPERSRACLEVLLVGLGACALATSDALGAVFFQSPRINALFILIPLVTPGLLLAYATRRPATVAS
jgi:hypothetical protein